MIQISKHVMSVQTRSFWLETSFLESKLTYDLEDRSFVDLRGRRIPDQRDINRRNSQGR